jgi:hypothetical protein
MQDVRAFPLLLQTISSIIIFRMPKNTRNPVLCPQAVSLSMSQYGRKEMKNALRTCIECFPDIERLFDYMIYMYEISQRKERIYERKYRTTRW